MHTVLVGVVRKFARVWFKFVCFALLVGLVVFGAMHVVPDRYAARTIFMPPQPSQGGAAAALQSMGALTGVAVPGATRNIAEQYVALLWTKNISSRVLKEFNMQAVYGEKSAEEARRRLHSNLKVEVGKKDGLVTLIFEDEVPSRAAEVANAYIKHLKDLTDELAITEAQQRRVLFERQLDNARKELKSAEVALQKSRVDGSLVRAEPKATFDAYATLRARLTDAELKVRTLARVYAEGSSELAVAKDHVFALREELKKVERLSGPEAGDYVEKYRNYKYFEALVEVFAKQYEMARLDEAKESALIQVVDEAVPPEEPEGPKRVLFAVAATASSLVLLFAVLIAQGVVVQLRAYLARDADTTLVI